jgi:spore germination protein KB
MTKGGTTVGKVKISSKQLFALIVLFELGSALVVGLGIDAGKDAWLAILLGWAGAMAIMWIYGYLFRQYPNLPLTGYLQKILGKYIGWLLGLLYTIYFIYIAARVLRDFGELLYTSSYDLTPLFVINGLLILTISYVLYKGFEVLGRTGEIFFVILIIVGLVGNLLVFMSGLVDVKNVLPFLEKGWKPVFKAAFPLTFTFPFGEMITFTMLFPYLKKPKDALKVSYSAMTLSAVILSLTMFINLGVLGMDITSRSTFPLLLTVGKINIANFLQNLEMISIITLIIGGFFKVSIFFYTAIIGIANLFKIEKKEKIVLPIAIIILLLSVQIANNLTEHLSEGLKVVPLYIHLPFQTGIPLLLLIVVWIRKRLNTI